MNLVEATGEIVPEPDWSKLFSDELEIAEAHERWRIATTEMRERGLLSASNGHSLQRLIVSYIAFDRAAREVAEHGAVTKPRRGNSKAIARISPWFTAMREASADATALEAKLGLTPRDRSSATKAQRVKKTERAADAYLRPVSK